MCDFLLLGFLTQQSMSLQTVGISIYWGGYVQYAHDTSKHDFKSPAKEFSDKAAVTAFRGL